MLNIIHIANYTNQNLSRTRGRKILIITFENLPISTFLESIRLPTLGDNVERYEFTICECI